MATDQLILIPTTTYTASTTEELGSEPLGEYLIDCRFILIMTAAATDGTDTFDLHIQSSPDKDAPFPVWDDFVAFTQRNGTATGGGNVFEIMTWSRSPTPEDEGRAPSDAALTANNVLQGPVGRDWRAKISITSGNAASFTIQLVGDGMFYK